MSDQKFIFCTNCGAKISGSAKFCRFCGKKTKLSGKKTDPTPLRREIRSETQQANSRPPVEVTEPYEEIPEDILNILYSRKRNTKIDSEMRKLLSEVEQIEKKLEVGLMESSESTNLITGIKENLTKLQAEKKSLTEGKIKIESLIEDKNKFQTVLEKLEDKKRLGEVSEEVYRTLHKDYSTNLNNAKRDLGIEERKCRRWIVQLRKDTKKLQKEAESIKVRAEIETIIDPETTKQISELLKKSKKQDIAADVLGEILDKINDF